MVKTAIMFGTQRCGSNFFLSACQKLDDLTVFGEMYHRGGAFPFERNPKQDFSTKQRLGEILRASFPAQSKDAFAGWAPAEARTDAADALISTALVRFSHRAPNRYYEALQLLAKKSRLIFKIFPEHLEMVQVLSILREQRPHVLLMLRNPLDVFISEKKLVETKKPQDVDTTGMTIQFNPAEYFAHKAAAATYFRTIREYCEHVSLPVHVCHYEWLHNGSEAAKVEKVRDQLKRLFGETFELSVTAETTSLFKRQDSSLSPADKVANPGALPRAPQTLLCD
jgi:hypothetical protein